MLVFGGATSLRKVIELLDQVFESNKEIFSHLEKLSKYIKEIGSIQLRNTASLAGNLALAKKCPEFLSDLIAPLTALNAKLELFSVTEAQSREVSISEYFPEDTDAGSLIQSICIPLASNQSFKFSCSKICPREDNARSFMNAAFRWILKRTRQSNRTKLFLVVLQTSRKSCGGQKRNKIP
eukprot:TRINITY_DN7789_c0_g1_i1.p1 TRINITY_DN7789_c0_g1~~TRINITY_DN7789_c0_g1_i1.p1  ORF type:complete len:181 (-),score=27.91 TRINITY_DN7789_c0_g1_i1:58-600(-)